MVVPIRLASATVLIEVGRADDGRATVIDGSRTSSGQEFRSRKSGEEYHAASRAAETSGETPARADRRAVVTGADILAFGPYRFDPDSKRLSKDGEPIALGA